MKLNETFLAHYGNEVRGSFILRDQAAKDAEWLQMLANTRSTKETQAREEGYERRVVTMWQRLRVNAEEEAHVWLMVHLGADMGAPPYG